jgi:hypothetical protein
VKNKVGYVPPLPLDEEALRPALAVALSIAAHPDAHNYVILTRSGRTVDGHSEKLLIRTTSKLEFVDAFLLPVNAGELALIDSGKRAIVIDEEDTWHTCRLN